MIFAIKSAWYRGKAMGVIQKHFFVDFKTARILAVTTQRVIPDTFRDMVLNKLPPEYLAITAMTIFMEQMYRMHGTSKIDSISRMMAAINRIIDETNPDFTFRNKIASACIQGFCDVSKEISDNCCENALEDLTIAH